ncbi:hypothetical protein Tco_1247351 [Tanacetum coccineum]
MVLGRAALVCGGRIRGAKKDGDNIGIGASSSAGTKSSMLQAQEGPVYGFSGTNNSGELVPATTNNLWAASS